MDSIIEELAHKANIDVRRIGSMDLIKNSDIPAILDVIEKAELVVLGIEGFTLEEGDSVRPDMNAVADFSSVPNSIESIDASWNYFKEVNRPELMYEFVLKAMPPKIDRENIDPNRLWIFGGAIDSSSAGLRIFGDSLIPEEVTNLLGCEPTEARRKGDVIPDKRYHRIARTGNWILDDDLPATADIKDKIENILSRVTNDLAVWKYLGEFFSIDIYCGLFLDEDNRGCEFSSDLLKMLGERRINLGFDIWGPGKEEEY
jgi:hypothetical protein